MDIVRLLMKANIYETPRAIPVVNIYLYGAFNPYHCPKRSIIIIFIL